MSHFNLVDERWIPCILPNGRHEDLSLQDVLINAHKIEEVFDPSPLVTDSLHRLLLAILYRNFELSSISDWQEIWKAGRFDEKRLKDYLQGQKPRFNLFDDNRPFYQSPELKGAKKHPILHLAMEISSGNNATLFDHNSDDDPVAVSPATAARYVISTQAYAIGFGVSHAGAHFSDSTIIRGVTIMALGNTLFETLALNLLPRPDQEKGKPIWEQESPAKPNKDGNPVKGYLDYMTWQSRNIHLFSEEDPPRVHYCQIQQNLKLPKQSVLDPFKCYRKDDKKGLVPLPIKPERAIWRDSHSLFQTVDDSFKRPDVFNWLARIETRRRNGEIQARSSYSFTAAGLATDVGNPASVLLWRHERLPLPLEYLQDEYLLDKLREALEVAESMGRLFGERPIKTPYTDKKGKEKTVDIPSPLYILVSEMLPKDRNGKADPDSVKNLIRSLAPARPYWAQLGISFNELVKRLPADKSGENEYGKTVLPWWAGKVRQSARDAFNETTGSLDRTARMLKAVTQAENSFSIQLNKLLKPYLNTEKKGGGK